MEWHEEYPEIADLLHHIQDEGLYEEMANGYISADLIPSVSQYAHLRGLLAELERIQKEYRQWESHLYMEMNRFLPEEERIDD